MINKRYTLKWRQKRRTEIGPRRQIDKKEDPLAMRVQVFVDESQRKHYIICAAIISPNHLAQVRTSLHKLLLPGQRRLHFVDESKQRRQKCLTAMAELPVQARIYASPHNESVARKFLLDHLLNDLIPLQCERLVIESRGVNPDTRERSQIAAAIRNGAAPQVIYHHMRPHEEPLLWVADAIAWAYGAGGEWRSLVEPQVGYVKRV